MCERQPFSTSQPVARAPARTASPDQTWSQRESSPLILPPNLKRRLSGSPVFFFFFFNVKLESFESLGFPFFMLSF